MWTLILGLAMATTEPNPHPGVADPAAFLRARYALYARGEGVIPELAPIVSDRLRAQLDAHDQAAGGRQLINHDWWVEGREGEESRIGGLALAEEAPRDPGRRTIEARFRNHERRARLRFGFVREDGAWRLDEVISDGGWTLTGLLAERPR